MALQNSDIFLLQRGSDLKRTTIGDLLTDMQDTDLIMVQQSGTLKKTTWSNRNNLNDADLMVVGRSGGLRKTTWAEVKATLFVDATITSANNNTSTNEDLTLDDLFTQAQIESTVTKRITINSGAIVGSTNVSTPALSIASSHTIGGAVTVINNGSILGHAGDGATAPGNAGAAGGTGFNTSISMTFTNNGTISGGGGGGGWGGVGGNGQYQTNLGQGNRQGGQQTWPLPSCDNSCISKFGTGAFCDFATHGTNTSTCFNGLMDDCYYCARLHSTTGGAGGASGNGFGYEQSNTNGSAGSAGGTNAGTGGAGGNGGAAGQAGAAGGTGANGNVTNGSAGTAGGAAGNATTANGTTLTMTNNGTINGNQLP